MTLPPVRDRGGQRPRRRPVDAGRQAGKPIPAGLVSPNMARRDGGRRPPARGLLLALPGGTGSSSSARRGPRASGSRTTSGRRGRRSRGCRSRRDPAPAGLRLVRGDRAAARPVPGARAGRRERRDRARHRQRDRGHGAGRRGRDPSRSPSRSGAGARASVLVLALHGVVGVARGRRRRPSSAPRPGWVVAVLVAACVPAGGRDPGARRRHRGRGRRCGSSRGRSRRSGPACWRWPGSAR